MEKFAWSLRIEPTEAKEPMLPIDGTDPVEQMDRNEFWERQESM
ncbi:hypothetical protein [Kribbella sp. C-35]